MKESGGMQASTAEVAQSLMGELGSTSPTSPPATSQQMEEMIMLLRDISSKNSTPHNTNPIPTSSDNGIDSRSHTNTSFAYESGKGFLRRLSFLKQSVYSIPLACNSLRKWIGSNKAVVALSSMVIFMSLLLLSAPNPGIDELRGSPAYADSNISNSKKSITSSGGGVMSSFSIGSSKDETMYFNVNPVERNVAQPLPRSLYQEGGPAICTLVSNNEKDVSDLEVALTSLLFLKGDTDLLSPVLVFNEGDLDDGQIERLWSSTNRPIAFPLVDLTTFPSGFDPEKWDKEQHFDVKDRKPWGYYQMIRFFVTGIWEHPAIEHFETIMRIDSDSCFKAPNPYLPHMMYDQIVYHSQYVGVEPEAGRPYIEGLFDFVVEYMDRVNKSPGNMMLWHFIETTWNLGNTLPVYRTNLEVSKKSHMKRMDIKKWHRTLTEEEPFGLLRFRWGDAIIRFIEAAVFGTDDTVLSIRQEGYFHKRDCAMQEVEQALKKHNLHL